MELLREAAELEGDDLIPNAYWGPGTIAGPGARVRGRARGGTTAAREPTIGAPSSLATTSPVPACRSISPSWRSRPVASTPRFGTPRRALRSRRAPTRSWRRARSATSSRLIRAYQGERRGLARARPETGLAHCESQGDALFARMHRVALGFLELSARRQPRGGVEWLRPVAERFRAAPIEPGLPHMRRIPDAVEALTALDRLDEAEELARAAWDEAGERFERPRVRATAARCRALIAAARGELETALRARRGRGRAVARASAAVRAAPGA